MDLKLLTNINPQLVKIQKTSQHKLDTVMREVSRFYVPIDIFANWQLRAFYLGAFLFIVWHVITMYCNI